MTTDTVSILQSKTPSKSACLGGDFKEGDAGEGHLGKEVAGERQLEDGFGVWLFWVRWAIQAI